MTALHEAYYAAVEADKHYSAELQRLYGSRAGDARYNPRLNTATPELARLHGIWRQAEDARHKLAMEANTLVPTALEIEEMKSGAMTEEEKQEYRLDQQDEAEKVSTTEFIDITPKGCTTPEGTAKVNTAMAELATATTALALGSIQFFADWDWSILEHFDNHNAAAMKDAIHQIRALIGAHNRKQEAFLRAVAGK